VKNFSWIEGIIPLILNFGMMWTTTIKFRPWQM